MINKCYMIAEIGVNHSGSIELAKKMIDAAVSSGADAVKFQTFKAERLVSRGTPKVKYQESTTDINESHYEMIKSLEFKYEDHEPVINYCRKKEIDFISTPYDVESARFLTSLGVDIFKTASADIVDLSLHKYIALHGKKAYVSVGMATMGEIEDVVNIYKTTKCDLTLLHCVSNYPCAYASLNLNVMNTLSTAFGCKVGYSDHAIGSVPAVAAVALGATVIEKHFTLDKSLPGPDHKASSEPEEFAELVRDVRICEKSLGVAYKQVQEEELQMKMVSRKSLFIDSDIKEGECFEENHFTLKRPGTGLFERELKTIIGSYATRDLKKGTMLSYGDFACEKSVKGS